LLMGLVYIVSVPWYLNYILFTHIDVIFLY
jgi:hypothetical protein